ncbi:MAG TPA: hypothetical protein VL995_22320 [Cellvibrio sp.]|nr:hypothetical protein [Cellvibrio sp.]
MHTLKTTKIVSAAFISLILSACGGGASSPLDPQPSSGAANSGAASSGAVDTTSPVAIGFGFDSNFTKGVIGVGVGDAALSPGGTTNLTINIVSSTNTLAATPVQVIFNSPCIASGEAKITSKGAETNVVTSSLGEATVTYTASGCSGTDQITATAVINEKQEVARTALNISADTILAITSIDPEDEQISLKGTGGKETAILSFTVTGATGAPIKNVTVDFSLNSESGGPSMGGLALVNTTATSDKNGLVSTIVQAGTVATAVVVTAKARDTNIATQSKKLIVSTGIPDQDSFNLGADDPYPMGWDHNGIESTLTVRLADAFNNPVSDGTAVTFTTEGGDIEDGCTTEKGSCSVTWTSGEPRPVRNSSDTTVNRLLCVDTNGTRIADANDYETCVKERAGRVTIRVHAMGNESFIDTNANGLFDSDEDIFKTHNNYQNGNPECNKNTPLASSAKLSNSPRLPCDDLVEAYLDRNENGIRDNDEPYVDTDGNGAYSIENAKYNGILCRDNDPGCEKTKVAIRQESTLIMVSDHMLIDEDYGYLYGGQFEKASRFPFLTRTVYLDKRLPPASSAAASSASNTMVTNETSAAFWLADRNGNGAPAGTTIKIDTTGLVNARALLVNPGPLPASQSPTMIRINFSSGADTAISPSGFVSVTVTFPTPNGPLSVTDEVHVNNMSFYN